MMLLQEALRPAAGQAAHALACTTTRMLAVLAWGRNVEHQCGVEGVPLVARPTSVLELQQAPVTALVAGKLCSAAVQEGGEVYTWGDGTAGKLGHGSGESVGVPSRVEAFVGRSSVRGVALGHSHSLFLDEAGALWACGENKEGQLGMGTPLEVLASQHRRVWQDAMRLSLVAQNAPDRFAQYLRAAAPSSAGSSSSRSGATAATAPHVAHGWGSLDGGSEAGGSGGGNAAHAGFAPPAAHWGGRGRGAGSAWAGGGSGSFGLFGGGGGGGGGGRAAADIGALWGSGLDLEAHLSASGVHAGQLPTPARVGSAYASVLAVGGPMAAQAQSDGGARPAAAAAAAAAAADAEALASEVVVCASASRFYSLAATERGEVWAFGADFNGALGSEASWLSSARRVAPPIARALAEAGGATAVAAGGTFGAALTAAGSVLVWGKLGGGSPASPGLTAAAAAAEGGGGGGSGGMFARVALPPGARATALAAGQQHLLVTDGRRVWAVGRWLDASGEEAGAAGWDAPAELLSLPGGAGVAKLAAGMHSSAAVTADGRLWLWGRLMDAQHAAGIVRRFGGDKHAAGADWSSPLFGGAAPRLVGGELQGHVVRDVALGGWHALALVD